MERQIFISYSWKNEAEANVIDNSFSKDGIQLIRDKRDVNYKDSLKEFMKKVRETDYVLMVISDEYLKSPNCMYEVLEVLKDEDYKDRILPIVLTNAKIYSPANRMKYLEYWKSEFDNLKSIIDNHSPDEVISASEDLKIIRNIIISITGFLSIISDIKNIPFAKLKQNNFRDIKQKLGILVKRKTKIRYDILKQEDVSHVGAKRYSAQILIDSKYSQDEIKNAILEVNNALKTSSYYKNDKLKEHFKDKTTDVIWLFVAHRLSDINNVNWICRTIWINPDLADNMRPIGFEGNDSLDGITIEWNSEYDRLAEFYDDFIAPKSDFLQVVDQLFSETQTIIRPLIDAFNDSFGNKRKFKEVISYIEYNQSTIDEIYKKSGSIDFPPPDCKKLDELTQSYFATCHNLFLYFSKEGLETWKEQNRISLMRQDINHALLLEQQILSERKRL